MKLNHLILIGDAVEKIHELTEADIPDIVDALTGIAWDEEDAGQIKAYRADENYMPNTALRRGCKPSPPTSCSESGIYESQNADEVCDTCSGQEGLHYCLVRTTQVKNMNIMTCDEWASKIPNDKVDAPSGARSAECSCSASGDTP